MNEFKPLRCSRCDALIIFIRTDSGKSMPCDCNSVMYREDPNGEDRLYTKTGKLIRCSLDCDKDNYTGYGYKPHWGSCVSYEGRKRYDALKKPPAPEPKPKEQPKLQKPEEPKFEQLCMFGGDRRSRHPY